MTLLYTGRVMRIDPDGPIVRVPLLGRDALWGPLPTGVGNLLAGEQVVVGQLGSSRDQLIILCRLAPDAVGGSASLLTQLADTVTDQSVRLTSAESRLHGLTGRDAAVSILLETLRTRLETVENAATTLPAVSDVAALQVDMADVQTRLAALEAWRAAGGGATP